MMNEMIEILLYFVSTLFMIIFLNLCYIKINNHKFKLNIKNIGTIFIMSFLIFINNSYDNLWLKLILTSTIFCVNFKILYKDNWKNTIISYIIIYVLLILLEIIATNILLKTGVINNNYGVSMYNFVKFSLSICISLLEYLFFSIKIINTFTNKLINFFVNNINTANVSLLLLVSIYVIGLLNFENFAIKGSIKLIAILLLIFMILFLIIIRLKYKEEILKESNKRLMEYNENYGKFLDEYKIYKHNIKHKLAGMKSFGNKKINALIDDLLEEENSFTIKNNNLYNIPNGIKGIVAERLYNKDIDVLIDNKLENDPFIKLKPKVFNSISEAIGICLDNAVEASLETDEPVISIYLHEDEEYAYIKISNNFCNVIDVDKLENRYYSTKNRDSGLGLFSVNQNDYVKERIIITPTMFNIELQIKK